MILNNVLNISKKNILVWFYKILFFIFLYLCLQYYIFSNIKANIETSGSIKEYKEDNEIIPRDKGNKFIRVNNSEGEHKAIAEIIIQNKIKYIPKISVIIYVYNSGEYLNNCLDTIINQTLKDIEIICIDDDSTDDSLDILKKYAEKDERLTIMRQENLYSGVAYNTGIDIAKGKYLSFIDSDVFFEFDMLEEMYKNIVKKQSDIIICKIKSFNLKRGKLSEQIFNNNLRLKLIPNNSNNFSVFDIPNNVFQFCEGWVWDKLFKTDFILSNHIRFQNIENFNDVLFTYTALCSAKSITTTKRSLAIKMQGCKNTLFYEKNKESSCYLKAFDKMRYNLEKMGLYDLVKKSFLKWSIKSFMTQLKYLDKISKEYLYNIFREKFNLWDYNNIYDPSSNMYRVLHYMKYHKIFPTINIAYLANKDNLNACLVSFVSVLKNSEYENINFILLFKDITQIDLQKINKLKDIHSFSLKAVNISNLSSIIFSSRKRETGESWLNSLLINILSDLYEIDKLLYLGCNTIVRKSLLSLWEIDMNDKLIAGVKVISFNKNMEKIMNIKDGFYLYDNILLFNLKQWRKEKLFKKIRNYDKNQTIYISHQDILNIFGIIYFKFITNSFG